MLMLLSQKWLKVWSAYPFGFRHHGHINISTITVQYNTSAHPSSSNNNVSKDIIPVMGGFLKQHALKLNVQKA